MENSLNTLMLSTYRDNTDTKDTHLHELFVFVVRLDRRCYTEEIDVEIVAYFWRQCKVVAQ